MNIHLLSFSLWFPFKFGIQPHLWLFYDLSFVLLQQQEILVLILVFHLAPQEQGAYLELTTKWLTAAMATCFWWGRVRECVRRTASGLAKSQHATVRQIPTNTVDIVCFNQSFAMKRFAGSKYTKGMAQHSSNEFVKLFYRSLCHQNVQTLIIYKS